MAHLSGSAFFANWIYSGGTVTITGDQRKVDTTFSVDLIDTTAGSDTDKTHVTGVKDGDIVFSFITDYTAGSAMRRGFAVGTGGTLQLGPAGSAVGNPKYVAPYTVKDNKGTSPYDGALEFTITLQKNGAYSANFDTLGSVW